MSDIYGDIGNGYIELHHKIPYSEMVENDTRILTQSDFCVLCPNCHKMVHKLDDAGDIELLSSIVKANKDI
jgi:5-methylcytosine-specific restriction protein A